MDISSAAYDSLSPTNLDNFTNPLRLPGEGGVMGILDASDTPLRITTGTLTFGGCLYQATPTTAHITGGPINGVRPSSSAPRSPPTSRTQPHMRRGVLLTATQRSSYSSPRPRGLAWLGSP